MTDLTRRIVCSPSLHTLKTMFALAAGLGLMAGATVAAESSAQSRAPVAKDESAKLPVFDVYQYVVAGNSVLKPLEIEAAVTPFLGVGKNIRDVEAARAALEKSYHDAGYLTVLVSIPDQAVDSGEVSLQVVEAVVERLKVAGAAYTLPSDIKAGVPELAAGNVPNFKTIQDQLALVNRRPDARVTPVLKAGLLPGTVEVQLDVEDQLPLHGSVELNNRQTPNTTASRLMGSLRYDNLWQLGHSVSLTLQTSPERTGDAKVAALTYVMPTGRANDALSIYGVRSRSVFASLANAPGMGLLGDSDTMGMRYSMPLKGSSETAQSLSAGFDYKDIRQTTKLADGSGIASPVSYMSMAAGYSLNLFGPERSSSIDLSTALGMRRLGGTSDAEFDAKRKGASASFVAFRGGLRHNDGWQGWGLLGRLDFQLASGPLLPSEQMSAGGADSVRGYLEGERAGDMGLHASFELRTPQYSPAGVGSAWRLGGLAFLDVARLTTLRAVAPQPGQYSLAGIGVGLRLSAPGGVALDLDAASALIDGDTTSAHSVRVHARAVLAF
ncbi:ShlB/FhaC/HecB family hemolysin secretion/activation protein [Paucibacter sp. TC2R-5]|uniref:ShlB/FhaC/HecB family hemolysin secretion/activation protein n=1 Tax=Paucibacter sp. TC2R-5 TaxID=2893555 RepID=UPI0021E4CC1F|nr:ShlB/FhaC/HecB family hemolysin secretion/activation protein [Paucibacter sp. TC2R-5]MCV2359147.1 ShlB/FhaC/HecB family hemolysin secretion/activation protein [Paucibacter sp. TC2R-5]